MMDRELDKALEIVSVLITGGEIKKTNEYAGLYEEFTTNSGVYDMVMSMLKKFNLSLFEYKDGLYVSPGENNKIFGYTNDEIKKELGVRLNRELYLCYFITLESITAISARVALAFGLIFPLEPAMIPSATRTATASLA